MAINNIKNGSINKTIPTETIQSVGRSLGSGMIEAIQKALAELFGNSTTNRSFFENFTNKSFNLDEMIGSLAGAVNLTNSSHLLAERVNEAIGQFETKITGRIEDLTSRLSQNATVGILPYALSAIALLTGTPFAVHYLYKKALQKLSKPKLAAEVYKINDLERFGDFIQRGLQKGLQCAASGLKWGGITAVMGAASMLPMLALGHYNSSEESLSSDSADLPLQYLKAVGQVSGAVAAATTAYQLVKQGFSSLSYYINASSDPNPIFNDKISSSINEIVESTRNIRDNGGFFQHLCLYGRGGTGKTMVAKMIAKKSGMNCILLSGAALPACIKQGEHINALRELFHGIKEPTVVFIDEIESLAKNRDLMQRPEELELLNELLNLTGVDSSLILLIAATNKPNLVDRDMMTRFNRKIFVDIPGQEERIRILDEHLPYFFTRKERETVLNPMVVSHMAEYTEGLTGRALFKMVNSLYAKKMMSKDKTLRPAMISTTMEQFVEQERELEKWQRESFYTSMPSVANRKFSEAVSSAKTSFLGKIGLLSSAFRTK